MKKVVDFPGNFRNPNAKRPCSFSTVSDKGNKVYGIAAFLVIAKRQGGVDALITSISNDAAIIALENAIKGGQGKIAWSILKTKAGIIPLFLCL